MTRETYRKSHSLKGKHENNIVSEINPYYEPKHGMKLYYVWRVLGPAGPQETICVYGIDNVKQAILGCWDWEVSTADGKVVRI